MSHPSDIAFSPSVKAAQEDHGSRAMYANPQPGSGWETTITPARAAFIGARDSFYMATASKEGRPYVQHRGGPRGFLKVLDERRLAFADFSGNRQYISAGNLAENDRVCLFLMDYPGRTRLKIWGRAEVVTGGAELDGLIEAVADPEYGAAIEQVMVVTIEVLDGNCPQHIQPRYSQAEVDGMTAELRDEIVALKRRLAE